MTKLSQQLNQQTTSNEELNGFINNSPIYVTSLTATESINNNPTANKTGGGGGGGSVLSSTTTVVAVNKDVVPTPKPLLPNGHSSSDLVLGQQQQAEPPSAPNLTKDSSSKVPNDIRVSSAATSAATNSSAATSAGANSGQQSPSQQQQQQQQGLDVRKLTDRRASSPFQNGRTELLIDDNKFKTTAIVESNNNKLGVDLENRPRRRSGSSIVVLDGDLEPVKKPPDDFDDSIDYNNMVTMLAGDNGPHREMAVDVPDTFIARNKTPPRYPPPKPIVQEQLRKRKEEEDRIAAQNEFLNRSLRGSRKLQALESRPQGTINDAFTEDETQLHDSSSRSTTPATVAEKEVVHIPYAYFDLVGAVQRLQLQLKKAGTGSGLGGTEGRVAAVQSLLLSPQFSSALAVYNKVQTVRSRTTPRPSPNAQTALRDCLDALGNSQSAYAVELATLLTGYELEALMVAHDGVASTLPADSTTPTPIEATQSPSLPDHRYGENNIKIIKIEKSTEPLGATVRNEGEAVVIGRVVRGGAADKSGLLHEGDEILEVNGIEMRGKSVNAVCDILQAMEGTLTFLIVPAAAQSRSHTGRNIPSILHVRAHFDYDPEEDMYIPCRELGISFQKGDVLHIISQEDANWWQAYREGEEDQTLAGLVPSQSFQHQRESMRLAAEERMARPQRKSSTLLCGKTTKRKKKKGVYADGGYPMYGNTADEYDPDEILTYEEVSLYYPRSDNKRPIVLIGPPNIGRHELRQRLMDDSERFAAAIPHTSRARKENEVDGQDYHFITRAQFEADILSRKFVEHGEYEKAYYGTSLDAIRSVVNSGKICVLNLHPQSLKILRTSDLKPYVVFVAPPSLEKLRQKKIRNGESYKEEELKDIIEKAREMEDKYGHFFDMIIINNDTERAYHQLLSEINSLEREPQWVPAAWVKAL